MGINTHYGNFHGINLLASLVGVLPEDKRKLMTIMIIFYLWVTL